MHFPTMPTALALLSGLMLSDLAGAAPAASSSLRQLSRRDTSKGFQLVANVLDASKDLSPSVDGWALTGIHVGAGMSRATLSSGSGRVFYNNGTASEVASSNSRVLTDGGTPPFPWSLDVQSATQDDAPANPGFHAVYLNAGPGAGDTPEASISPSTNSLVNNLGAGTYIACNHTVPYYGPTLRYIVLDFHYGDVASTPAGCAPIALLPKCDVLNELPPDAISSHVFAVDQTCSANPAASS